MPTLQCYTQRAGTGGAINIDTVTRPDWLRGRDQAALLVRNEVFFDLVSNALFVEQNVLSRCGLCWEPMDQMGAQAEHLIQWRHFAKFYWDGHAAPTTLRALEDAYHEQFNIYAGHGGCNGSKGTKDVFEWWRSDSANTYVDVGRRTRIRAVLTDLHENDIDYLSDFPLGTRKTVLRLMHEVASDAHWGDRARFVEEITRWIPELDV